MFREKNQIAVKVFESSVHSPTDTAQAILWSFSDILTTAEMRLSNAPSKCTCHPPLLSRIHSSTFRSSGILMCVRMHAWYTLILFCLIARADFLGSFVYPCVTLRSDRQREHDTETPVPGHHYGFARSQIHCAAHQRCGQGQRGKNCAPGCSTDSEGIIDGGH